MLDLTDKRIFIFILLRLFIYLWLKNHTLGSSERTRTALDGGCDTE